MNSRQRRVARRRRARDSRPEFVAITRRLLEEQEMDLTWFMKQLYAEDFDHLAGLLSFSPALRGEGVVK